MRISSKVFVSSIGLGIMAISYAAGAQAQSAPSFSANGATDAGATPVTSTAPVDNASTNPTTTAIVKKHTQSSANSGKTSTTVVKKPAIKKPTKHTGGSTSTSGGTGGGTTPTTTPQPTTPPTTPPVTPPASTTVTHQSAAIGYQFGTIQISVTEKDGKITDISQIKFGATNGRASAWAPLVKAAKAANGANFGNLSGATYTTQAFKDALKSALSKF